MSVNWNYPTRILTGAGRAGQIVQHCLHQGITSPMVVTDPGIAGLPMFQAIMDAFATGNIDARVFSDIKANPTGQNVDDGVKKFLAGKHDGIVAIGGGSALDVGKAIALVARQDCKLWDLEDAGDNWKRADVSRLVPVIALPTTAGTGSEVGRASLITHEAQRRKVIVFHPMMTPHLVILDPELSVGLPPALTAATGMDALSHNLEAWCAPTFHPMAEGIAVEGMRLVKEYLPKAVADGTDLDARMHMLAASTMGAVAFQRGLGAMHALAHPLGAVYDAHHGLLNAVLMPYVLKANATEISARAPRLAAYLGLSPDFDALMAWILSLREQVGIPSGLEGIVTRDEHFDKIGEMAIQDPSAATNARALTASEYQQVLVAAFEAKL